METLGNRQTVCQIIHLLLIDVLSTPFGDDSACANVVKIVQILSRVATHLVGVDGHQSIDRLILQTHIIIIGGIDDGKLRFAIAQTTLLAVVQLVALFVDTLHAGDGAFTEIVKVLVMGTTLTKAHLLHIANEQFYLIVSKFRNVVQGRLRLLIIHLCHLNKGQMV